MEGAATTSVPGNGLASRGRRVGDEAMALATATYRPVSNLVETGPRLVAAADWRSRRSVREGPDHDHFIVGPIARELLHTAGRIAGPSSGLLVATLRLPAGGSRALTLSSSWEVEWGRFGVGCFSRWTVVSEMVLVAAGRVSPRTPRRWTCAPAGHRGTEPEAQGAVAVNTATASPRGHGSVR